MSIWSLTYQQSAFKWCHSNKHSPSFTHNMTAKTSWHRRGTKLRHCHPMYTAAFCNCLLGQWRQIIHMSLTEVCSNPCVKLGRLLKAREDQICRYCGCCSEALKSVNQSIYYRQKDQMATYIIIKYMTYNGVNMTLVINSKDNLMT